MTMEWMADAACAGRDPEVWFPLDEGTERLVAPARTVCAGCPVAQECLAWALDVGFDVGVFGGRTADERRALRRQGRRLARTG